MTRLLAAYLLLLLLLAGCEAEVTAVTGTELAYSVYGVLSPDLDTQKALVYPIEGTLAERGVEPLDAVVRSVDLTTGEEQVWIDSLLVDSAGRHEHVFQAEFQAEFGHAYRLSVTRSDGASTHVETTVPPRTDVRTGPARVFPGVVTLPAIVDGDAPRLLKIVVTYDVFFVPVVGGLRQLSVSVPYDGEQKRVAGDWQIDIDLRGDYPTVERAAVTDAMSPVSAEYGIRIQALRLQLIVAAEDWDPPDGVFDAEVIVQPGTMSNVQNGYGFLAAGYRHNHNLEIPDGDVLRAAGFASADD